MTGIEKYRSMKTDELHNELERMRRHLFNLRTQAVTEKLEDSTQLVKSKRDIARILTVMRDRNETRIEQRQHHLTTVAARSH